MRHARPRPHGRAGDDFPAIAAAAERSGDGSGRAEANSHIGETSSNLPCYPHSSFLLHSLLSYVPHPDHLRPDATVPRPGAVSDQRVERADGGGPGRGRRRGRPPGGGRQRAGRGRRIPPAAEVVPVVSTEDMLAACLEEFPACDGLIAVAAPCDYGPVAVAPHKIRKTGKPLEMELVETPDIVAGLAAIKTDPMDRGLRLGNRRPADAGDAEAGTQELRLDRRQRAAGHSCGRHARGSPRTARPGVRRLFGCKSDVAKKIFDTIQRQLIAKI